MKNIFFNRPQKVTSEFNFLIKITHPERDAYQIRKKISNKFSKILKPEFNKYEFNENDENGIYRLIKLQFNKHFNFLGDSKAYLSNYEEKEGSLLISFTVVVIYSITNYGSIRETIDYFNDDLDVLLRHHLDDYSITNRVIENTVAENITRDNFSLQIQQLNRKIFITRIMISIVFFFAIVLSLNSYLESKNHISTTELENIVESEIEKYDSKQKLNYIYYKNIQSDSAKTKSNKK